MARGATSDLETALRSRVKARALCLPKSVKGASQAWEARRDAREAAIAASLAPAQFWCGRLEAAAEFEFAIDHDIEIFPHLTTLLALLIRTTRLCASMRGLVLLALLLRARALDPEEASAIAGTRVCIRIDEKYGEITPPAQHWIPRCLR